MTAPVDLDSLSATMSRIAALQQRLTGIRTGTLTTAVSPSFSSALATATATATGGTSDASPVGSPPASAGGYTGADVVADATKYLGVPYVFAGTTRQGMDCSGLVQTVYKDLGVSLPRIAADQAKVGTPVASLADAQPGDVLAFGDPAYHVALYVGDGKMIAAPEPGDHVKIQNVYQTPSTIRRILPASGAAPASTVAPASATTLPGRSPAVMAFEPQFAAAEKKYGLPAGMLSAVAQQESGGRTTAVSPAGAQGLMQLMPGTAASLGVDPFNPSQAIDGAARLLARNLAAFKTVPLALAAYNAGGGAVQKYGGIPPYAETQDYVKRITATMGLRS